MYALCMSCQHPHHPHTDGSDTESGEEGDDGVGGGGGGGGGGTVADNPLASLKEKLRELSTAHDLVVKNCHQVMKLIPTEVVEEGGGGGGGGRGNGGGSSKLKEKLTMFKITANAMAKVLYKFPFISQLQLNYTHSTLLSHFTISM